MLTAKEIHLRIDQGLNTLGIFVELANLHSQVDIAVNHVVQKFITRLLDTDSVQRNTLEQELVEFLTRRQNLPLERNGRYWEATKTDQFYRLNNSMTLLGLCKCKSDDCIVSVNTCLDCKQETDPDTVLPGYYYVAEGDVKYNGKWYKDGQIFKALSGITDVQGKVYRLKTKEKNNFNVGIDSLESFSLSAVVKNSFRPVLAFDANKFYIYYSPFLKGSEIPFELNVNYIIGFQDSMKISWCDNKTLAFPQTIQTHFIDEAIAYLAIVGKQDPNNIALLKQETI